ncbi:putative rna-directed dna polymerase from transposon bs [Trichonephila clavipes]|nr:putative rna-directed dna polymerase from transposon bs [Trichonephila clavipes]
MNIRLRIQPGKEIVVDLYQAIVLREGLLRPLHRGSTRIFEIYDFEMGLSMFYDKENDESCSRISVTQGAPTRRPAHYTPREVVLQWIPSHCGIHGNEQAGKLAKEASTLHPPCHPTTLRNAKRLLRDKLRQKRISTLTDLAVGQRRAQLSALSRVEGVACFRIITGHDYLQAHLFKIGLADSPLCTLCKSVPMAGEHLSTCPALLHVLSQDNCGVLIPARATSALYWTARRLMSERTLAGVI